MKIGTTFRRAATALVCVSLGSAASGESQSAVLDVSAIVPAICKVSNPDLELDLGSVTAGERQRIGKIAVNVICPAGIPYAITLEDNGQTAMLASDNTTPGPNTPIATRAVILGANGTPASSSVSRVGTGDLDPARIQVTVDFTGNEVAGSYSQQMTLSIDW